jgi:pantoate kinase
MTNFNQLVPEKRMMIEVTAREAHLIKVLRSIDFGDIVIKKIKGIPVRIEPRTSILLDELEGIDLGVMKKDEKIKE